MPAESLILILISEVRMTPSPPDLGSTSLVLAVIICLISLGSTDQTLNDDVDVGVGVFNNEGKLKSKSQSLKVIKFMWSPPSYINLHF